MQYDLYELLREAEETTIQTSVASRRSGNNRMSFGIVNSAGNGKRLSFSSALAEALKLEKTVAIVPMPKKDLLIIGVKVPNDKPMVGNLSDSGSKKLCYNASAVLAITEMFGLSFDRHTSQSFDEIEIEEYNGTPIAIIHIFDKYPSKEDGASNLLND